VNPPESSSSNSREKWVWVLVLASPIYLTLIGFILFQAIPPGDPLLRNMAILFLIVLGIGVLVLITRLAAREANKNTEQFRRQMEVAKRIAPDAFSLDSLQLMLLFRPRKRSRRSTIFRMVAIILVWLLLSWLVTQGRPEWSGALNGFTALIVGLLAFVVWDLSESNIRNAREGNRPIPRRTIVGIAAGSFVIGISGILLASVLEPWSKRPANLPIILLMGIGVFALVFLPIGWDVLLGEYVRRPLRRLDYARALAHALQLEKWIRSSTWKSIVLLNMGRPEEAETAIRESNTRLRRSLLFADSFLGWRQENLGYALTEQNRYTEAATAFEDGLAFDLKDSDRLTALAEVYMRQGIEPQRALDLTDRSLKHKQPAIINRLFMRNSIGELRANRAWALALAGRYQEAREALEQAFKEYDKSCRLSAASMYWRAGHVMKLRGDERAAREHFARAVDIDRNGNYGRMARQILLEYG
jgi:hypothetical protein